MWFEADKIGFDNKENHYRAFWKDDIVWNYVTDDNKIYYISTDGNVITPNIFGNTDGGFGANIVSNTYTDGIGVITFDGPVTRIGNGTFLQKKLKDIFIPASVTGIYSSAFESTGIKVVHLPKNVRDLSGYSCAIANIFYVSVDPENSTYEVYKDSIINSSTRELIIGTNTSVLDSGISVIGVAAFSGRKGISSITIPQGITQVKAYTFDWSNLSSVVIPSSVTSIDREAFARTKLTSVTIPSSVNQISYYAFSDCTNLVDIRVNATVPPTIPEPNEYNGSIFGVVGSVSGRQIKVPASKVNVYKSAAGWSYYASEIVSQ
jgi:hypothetical protein